MLATAWIFPLLATTVPPYIHRANAVLLLDRTNHHTLTPAFCALLVVGTHQRGRGKAKWTGGV